jgi:transcription initiation factor TFIID subunit 1
LNKSQNYDETESNQQQKKLILTIPKKKLAKHKIIKPLKLHKLKQKLQQHQQRFSKQPSVQLNTSQNQHMFDMSTFTPQTPQTQQVHPLQSQCSSSSHIIAGDATPTTSLAKQRRKPPSSYDYLDKPQKKVDRRHTDPVVTFSTILENILNELRDSPYSQPFLQPVSAKKVPDYYKVIKSPIDLQTIRKKIHDKHYKDLATFLADIHLLVDNSTTYNGHAHVITIQAQSLYDYCMQRVNDKRDKLTRLEKAINPLLDDNSLIAFNYILEKLFDENIMSIENSYSFLKPVNKAKYKDYYDIVKCPIDLETIRAKILAKKYTTKDQFTDDFELLYDNCVKYNGLKNSYTITAERLLAACKSAIDLNADKLVDLQKNITTGNYDLIDITDMESSNSHHMMASASFNPYDSKAASVVLTSPVQSIYMASDQDIYVDVEEVDDNKVVLIDDDLQISEDDEDKYDDDDDEQGETYDD